MVNMICIDILVLNNESVEYHEEYCPSDVIEALRDKNWIISSDEQVGEKKLLRHFLQIYLDVPHIYIIYI